MSHNIPVDQRIVDEYFRLDRQKNLKSVAWLFAMIATYGIKPEELDGFDWGPENTLVIPGRKRAIHPLHPQWVFLFSLNKKRPCNMQDRLVSHTSHLYRLMAHQMIGVNITDLLLAHRVRKNLYRPIKQQKALPAVYAGVS